MRNYIYVVAMTVALAAMPAMAGTYELTIKDHKFTPAEIKVPAGKEIMLHVKNLDADAEEFDSDDLKAEKVIKGNSDAMIRVRALKAGRYEFEGEYHSKTAQGVLIAE